MAQNVPLSQILSKSDNKWLSYWVQLVLQRWRRPPSCNGRGTSAFKWFCWVAQNVRLLQISSKSVNKRLSYWVQLVLQRWHRPPSCMGVALPVLNYHVGWRKMYYCFKFHPNLAINGWVIDFSLFYKMASAAILCGRNTSGFKKFESRTLSSVFVQSLRLIGQSKRKLLTFTPFASGGLLGWKITFWGEWPLKCNFSYILLVHPKLDAEARQRAIDRGNRSMLSGRC